MLKINMIVVGKTKERWLQTGEEEFTKRLRGSVNIGIEVVRAESVKKWKSPESIKSIEGERIVRVIPRDSFTVALDLHGKELSSEELAKLVKEKQEQGRALTFIIGGALGLSGEVTKRAELILSFSRLTFTHQMVRLILLEQLYRALSIISGKEYHR